jgi:prophage antirepressor-like protein
MDQPQIFNHSVFGSIRTVEVNSKPHFVGNDVAKALEYARPYEAVSSHCKGAVSYRVLTNGGEQEVKVIPEGDIYRLIVKAADQSKNPEIKARAEAFERWIFDEILPTIRKTGGYVANDELFIITYLPHADDQTKLMFRATLETVRKLNEQNAIMQPKAEFFDAVVDSKDAIDIGTTAKVLKINGIGRNNLFEILRNKGILMPNNQPYQRYVDAGYFRVIEQKYSKPDGSTNISIKTLVYQKGLDFIRKLVTKTA